MSRKIKRIELSTECMAALYTGYRSGETACYRCRNHMILLKSDGYSSKEIGVILGCSEVSVHNWVSRYRQLGIEGLQTKAGQGRKAKLVSADFAIIKEAVQEERQRLSQAKLIIETALGKQFSHRTLTRFLKVMTAVTSV